MTRRTSTERGATRATARVTGRTSPQSTRGRSPPPRRPPRSTPLGQEQDVATDDPGDPEAADEPEDAVPVVVAGTLEPHPDRTADRDRGHP